jgi:hypothetical protein
MAVLISGSLAFLLYTHGPLPTVESLVNKLHAPRKGITSFEVVIDAQKGEGKTHPHIEHVWRDGARYRVDFLNRFTTKGAARNIDCTNGPELGMCFTVQYDAVFDRSKAASLMPLSARKEIGGDRRFRFEDLGATPESFLSQAHDSGIEWYLGRVEETADLVKGAETRVERVHWKGQPAYKIVLSGNIKLPGSNNPRKVGYEVTLLPNRDFAAVSSRANWETEDRIEVRLSECKLARFSGIWLPETSICRDYTNDKQIARLDSKIEYIRLNKAPDPKVFTLAGMGLVRWTLVGTKDGTTATWDGSKLVPYEPLKQNGKP